MNPTVSVIIPCFNHGHYLRFALESVLAQTFSDWEAVVVDDGSTDNTREIAAQFTDPRIHYIRQENRGLSAARNTGIRATRSKYLAFLDADDAWTPLFFEMCIKALSEQETAVAVVTLARFIDESGKELPRIGGQVVRLEVFRDKLIEGGFFPPNAIVVQSAAVQRVGMFDESLTSVEDWDLWLRITATGGQILSIPVPLACYRVSVGSMSTNAGRMYANRLAVLTKHFGPPEGAPHLWTAEKRHGYAFANRAAALGYIAQHMAAEGWNYLSQAVAIEPELLERLDTFYELALGDQPRGYHGEATQLDIVANGAELLRRLEALFVSGIAHVQPLRGIAFGNAYLALAMLSDQAGQWGLARRYMWQAVRVCPRLLRQPGVVRRLLKLCVDKRIIARLQRLKSVTTREA